jgi:hypothetical protein
MPIISDMGDTSNLAATRGRRDLVRAEDPAKICVKLNCFCVASTNGVRFSGRKP